MSISPPKVELGGSKDWYGWNIIFKLHLIKEKTVQIKIVQNSIFYKNYVGAYVYLSQEWR